MRQDQPNDPSDLLFEEAALWHVRLRDAGPSAEPHPDFLAWVEKPQHRVAFEDVQRLWAASAGPAARVAAGMPAAIPALRQRSFGHLAMAASVALALAAGIWLLQGGLDNLRSDQVAAAGERRNVALADGSSILLNTDTAIAVDLQPQSRTVRMFRGEAFFKVTPDPTRPFIVQTGNGEIRVTGTAFNLRLSERGTVVSVVEGQVETANDSGVWTRLKARQQAMVSPAGVTVPAEFDQTRVNAWQRGQIVFYRTPLSEVVEELNRYHSGKILVWNEGLADLRVSGVFDAHQPAAAVDVIARTLPVRVTYLTGGLTLLR